MDEFIPTADPPTATRSRRGSLLSASLAWLVILLACGHVIWHANRPPTEEELANEPLQLSFPAELTAKLCVGLGEWSPDLRNLILDEARALDDEGPVGHIAKAVLAAELISLDEARAELAAVRDDVPNELNPARRETIEQLLEVLDRLYAEPDVVGVAAPESPAASAPVDWTFSSSDQDLLELHLGWVGRLAPLVRPLADGDSAREALLAPLRKMPLVMAVFLCWMGMALVGGLAALITLLVLGLLGRLRHGFGGASNNGRIYAEVFALWIAIFVGGNLLADHFALDGLWVTLVLTIGGLVIALGWAPTRGVPWRQVRSDLGLHTGRGLVTETLVGFMTYAGAIPILAFGFILTWLLLGVQRTVAPDAPLPGHPVQQVVVSGDWWIILQAIILASIIAPIVEEILFRGALYRHLRDSTWRFGLFGSFAVSAGLSSVLFAAIHPQGWPFIPVLGSLALAFCLAREWRGSLLPGIVAHGVNNFVIMILNVLLLG